MENTNHDPATGRGCVGERVETAARGRSLFLPRPMLDDPKWNIALDHRSLERLRFVYDFEYWAWRCVRIRHKITGANVAFVLNSAQQRVLAALERQRVAGEPIRLILLKARQWGGSTLIQVYMAWIQIIHRRNWHSLICAHVKDASVVIRGMYSKLLSEYPQDCWDEEEAPKFVAFERSVNTRVIAGRDCRVTLASSENQDAVRGGDYSMAHLSEVAFWKDSGNHSPVDFVRAVCAGIPLAPYSLIVIESTANGVGNYFHDMWQRSTEGQSGYEPVFVAWHDIAINRLAVKDEKSFASSLDDYERRFLADGLDKEQVNWYHRKRIDNKSHSAMMAEYPSTPLEAFTATDTSIFSREEVERLRRGCVERRAREVDKVWSEADVDAIPELRGILSVTGEKTMVWRQREAGKEYVVTVDVGGCSSSSDYSVIAVMAVEGEDGRPEVVAQWRGHIDHYMLAWKAAGIAAHYNRALLVIESNTLESERDDQSSVYILDRLSRRYPRLYFREKSDTVRATDERKFGFHTNAATKPLIIGHLVEMVRENGWIERDPQACNELLTYERRSNGSYGAKRGYHDDILMTRAIGLYVISTLPRVATGKARQWYRRSGR